MFEVFGFYKFTKIKSLKKNKTLLQDFLIKKEIRGTIIIANEGLNGTISGKSKNIKVVIYEPDLKQASFLNSKVYSDFSEFKLASDVIITNRYSEDLDDVSEKVFTRDLFGLD